MLDNINRFWDILLLVAVTWGFTLVNPKYSFVFVLVIAAVLIVKLTAPQFFEKKKKRVENENMEEN